MIARLHERSLRALASTMMKGLIIQGRRARCDETSLRELKAVKSFRLFPG
jgi:hypothetical protein